MVTVFIPVYNGEKYLREAIDSILAQTYTDFELLILDDGSTDGTNNVVSSYDDPRIRVMRNAVNSGLCVTRNRGLSAARGKYIAMLDCDDIACPNRLAQQISFFENAPEGFALLGSGLEIISEDGRFQGVSFFWYAPEEIPAVLLFNNCFAQSAIMGKAAVLQTEKYSEEVAFSEDYDLWVRIASKHKVWNIPNTLTKYRLHRNSTGQSNRNKMIEMMRNISSQQLKALGVDFGERELDIHFSIGMAKYGHSREYVEESERWMLKLLAANKFSRIYPDAVLLRVIRRHWLRLCIANLALGPWVLGKAFSSKLCGILSGLRTLLGFVREYLMLVICRSRVVRNILNLA